MSLDLNLMRKICQLLDTMPFMRSDLVAILDEWAGRFYEEMNYV